MAVVYDQQDACRGTQSSCKLYDMAKSPNHMVFAGDEVYQDRSLSRQGDETYSVGDTVICKQLAGPRPATFFTDDFGRQFCSIKKGSRAQGTTYIKKL